MIALAFSGIFVGFLLLCLWYRIEKTGSLRKRVLTGLLLFVLFQPLTVLVSVAVTSLDDQSYYAASVQTLLDETLDALEAGEHGFPERLRSFLASQRLTYESRDNLLENARRFHDEGVAIRRMRPQKKQQAEQP